MQILATILTLQSLFSLVTWTNAVTCDFNCENNSTCGFCQGEPSFLGDVELCRVAADGKGRHCQCEPGWSGLRCAHKHESCYDADHSCFNGGKCIRGLEDIYGNDQYYCDCSNAKDDQGQRYVGKYCELKALELCDADGIKFCVNNKTCSASAATLDTDFCDCGDDYEGPHCEFQKDKVPDCDLKCEHDGICVLGIKNYALAELGYNDFWQTDVEAMYCQCTPGYFGVRCEIEAAECGNHHCFHGATCVSTTIDDAGEQFHCDCTTAKRHNESFAGLYCQYRSSVYCETNGTIEGRDFCVNDGTCKVGAPGCDCPSGFEGPMCEYDAKINGGEPDCKLECVNQGECTKGAKDIKELEGIEKTLAKDAKHSENFEHCICPQGYFGLTCDKKIVQCGSGEHVCVNGGKCVGDETNGWSCNCDDIGDETKRFTGAYCQHEASVYCTPNNKPGTGVEKYSFCANGGTCKSNTEGDGHTGCICPNDFEGENCEVLRSIETTSSSGRQGMTIFIVVFLLVVGVLAGAIYYQRRVAHRDEKDKDFALRDDCMSAPAPTHSTVHSMVADQDMKGDFGPARDHEGMELVNVEII